MIENIVYKWKGLFLATELVTSSYKLNPYESREAGETDVSANKRQTKFKKKEYIYLYTFGGSTSNISQVSYFKLAS